MRHSLEVSPPVSAQEAVQAYQSARRASQDKFYLRGGKAVGHSFEGTDFFTSIINPIYPFAVAAASLPIWSPRPENLRKTIFHGIRPNRLVTADTSASSGEPLISARESRQICDALKREGVLAIDRSLGDMSGLQAALEGINIGLVRKRPLSPGQMSHVETIVTAFAQQIHEKRAKEAAEASQRASAYRVRSASIASGNGDGGASNAAYEAATMSSITSTVAASYCG